MAEPGAITKTEKLDPPITHHRWLAGVNLDCQETYWMKNLYQLCQTLWFQETEAHMDAFLGGSCTFWMSLPEGKQTHPVPQKLLDYFLRTYLSRFVALFPNAIILAAGGKAKHRLISMNIDHVACSAFTRPESNKPRAKVSWSDAGKKIAERLSRRFG
jgi:hypothetical protein